MPSPKCASASPDFKRLAGGLGRRIELSPDLREKGGEVSLMRRPRHHRERLPLQPLGRRHDRRRVPADDEAAGRAHVDVAEVEFLARVGGYRQPGDDRVGITVAERRQQVAPGARLDRAVDHQLRADRPRKVDVEAGQAARGVEKVERRKIVRGDEAYDFDRTGSGPLHPPLRIPEVGNHDSGRRRGLRLSRNRG